MGNKPIGAEAYSFSTKEEEKSAIGYNEEEHTGSESIEESKERDKVSIGHHISSTIEHDEEEDELYQEKHSSIKRGIHSSVEESIGRESKPGGKAYRGEGDQQ